MGPTRERQEGWGPVVGEGDELQLQKMMSMHENAPKKPTT